MYLCRELTSLSLPKIGQLFGNRDHTTVMYANKKISELMKERRSIYNQVTEITAQPVATPADRSTLPMHRRSSEASVAHEICRKKLLDSRPSGAIIPVLHSVENLWITPTPCGNSVVETASLWKRDAARSDAPRLCDHTLRSRSTTHTVVVPVSRHRSAELSTVPTGVKTMTEK